jgi:hypothetical protein
MDRPAGRFWTNCAPSVASSGSDDSMDSVETQSVTNCVPSVPRTVHNSQQQIGSESCGIEEGQGALSLWADNGSLRSDLDSRTQRRFVADKSPSYGDIQLGRWVHSFERHEAIACGISSEGFKSLLGLGEPLRLLSSQIDSNVGPNSVRIFEPQATVKPRQLELPIYPRPNVFYVTLPDTPRVLPDDRSQASDLDPEDDLEDIKENLRVNFRDSLSNLATNDQLLADRLIHRLSAEVNLILPLFDGRGLDALLLPEHSENTEHAQDSKPAQSAGSTVPNAKGSASKSSTQGASKRWMDRERDDDRNDQNSKRNKKDPPSLPPAPPPKKAIRLRFKCTFSANVV